MATELERLKAWMIAAGHDGMSLSRAMRYSGRTAVNIVNGKYPINRGFEWRFNQAFGAELTLQVLGTSFASEIWKEQEMYPEQYAAHVAVGRARSQKQLLAATAYKCHGCNKQAQRYHHQSYRPEDHLCIVPLCNSCHSKAHWGSLNITFGVVPTSVGLIHIAIAGL